MSLRDRFRTTLVAIGFAITMVLLGLMNPNATTGEHACGLVCDAQVETPLGGLARR